MTEFTASDWTFGNDPRAVLIALGAAAAVLVTIAAVRAIVQRRLGAGAHGEPGAAQWLLVAARRTRLFLLAPPVIALCVRSIDLPDGAAGTLAVVSGLTLLAQVASWVSGFVDLSWRRYGRTRVENNPAAVTTVHAFRFASIAAVWLVAALVAIDNLGFDVTALVAGLGIGGVAVALATQSILADLFASLSIVVDKPFVVGEMIQVDQDIGTVERIGLKTTRIRSVSGEQVIFGNGDLLRSRIRNYQRMAERRAMFRIGVVYGTPAAKLERIPQIVRDIIKAQAAARFDRGHFAEFGPSEYIFEFVYYVTPPDVHTLADCRAAIYLNIVRAFAEEGIEFAFPTRTVHLQGPARSD